MKWLRARLIGNVFVLCELTCDPADECRRRIAGIRVARSGKFPSAIRKREETMTAQQPLDDVLRRVQGEYREMPGLRLTTAQAQRLWGLDRAACDALLGALVDAKFLFRTRDGAFMRSDQALATRT